MSTDKFKFRTIDRWTSVAKHDGYHAMISEFTVHHETKYLLVLSQVIPTEKHPSYLKLVQEVCPSPAQAQVLANRLLDQISRQLPLTFPPGKQEDAGHAPDLRHMDVPETSFATGGGTGATQ
jgi:hypothetical protein